MELREVTQKALKRGRVNGSLTFHTKIGTNFCEYRIKCVNKRHLNLECSHESKNCPAILNLNLGQVETQRNEATAKPGFSFP